MTKVKFLRDSQYPQADPEQSKTYKAGETYDLEDDHAQRWIRRGAAVEVKAGKVADTGPKRVQAMVPHVPEKG